MVSLSLSEAKISYQRQFTEEKAKVENHHLVTEFLNLVKQHFYKKRQVSDYSVIINVSAAYLNNIVKEVTGKTPLECISDVLLSEAKVLVRTNTLTISEIAYRLRFSEPSAFNRFLEKGRV